MRNAVITSTTEEFTTTTEQITTTTSLPTKTTTQGTTTSGIVTSSTTTMEETTTSVAPTTTEEPATTAKEQPIHCCCRCCYDLTSSLVTSLCIVCGRQSLVDAAQCAAQPPPTPTPTAITRSTEPNFEPPAQLKGSRFTERLAFTQEFLAKQQLTEDLASLPLSNKVALGISASEFILDCTYDGTSCDNDR